MWYLYQKKVGKAMIRAGQRQKDEFDIVRWTCRAIFDLVTMAAISLPNPNAVKARNFGSRDYKFVFSDKVDVVTAVQRFDHSHQRPI